MTTDNIESIVHKIVRNSTDALAELEARYAVLSEFVHALSRRPCCNVCDCIACDAVTLLRKIGEEK